MLKPSVLMAGLLVLGPQNVGAQIGNAPITDPIAQRMLSCTASCHGSSLIAQQRLSRDAWTREVDKMIGWGAKVSSTEKGALVNYLALMFSNSRPRPNTFKAIPDVAGKDVFQVSCMSCHDQELISLAKRDRAGWSREVEKMIGWGAYVPGERKNELIQFLTTVNW